MTTLLGCCLQSTSKAQHTPEAYRRASDQVAAVDCDTCHSVLPSHSSKPGTAGTLGICQGLLPISRSGAPDAALSADPWPATTASLALQMLMWTHLLSSHVQRPLSRLITQDLPGRQWETHYYCLQETAKPQLEEQLGCWASYTGQAMQVRPKTLETQPPHSAS